MTRHVVLQVGEFPLEACCGLLVVGFAIFVWWRWRRRDR